MPNGLIATCRGKFLSRASESKVDVVNKVDRFYSILGLIIKCAILGCLLLTLIMCK